MRWTFAFSEWLGLMWSAGPGRLAATAAPPAQAQRRRRDTHVRPFGPSLNTRHHRQHHHLPW